MEAPLLVSALIDHAARWHGATEVVSVETAGGKDHSTWAEIAANSRRLASALGRRGIGQGDRCGTIAWNNRRHLELYFGLSGGGFVCHTINPRLHPDQMAFIINHSGDRMLFVDRTFLTAVAALVPRIPGVEAIVLMGPRDPEAETILPGLLFHDDLVAEGFADYAWPVLDEAAPSSLCYTSGTTGDPKGVLYTHRSTVLHALGGNQPDGLAVAARDSVMPVVPMFHVNAWGVPYISAATGCRLVLPGPGLDGESLVRLIDTEGVSLALGVPTIWLGLLAALERTGSRAESLKRTVVGGAALPPAMIPRFRDEYGVDLIHAWGMTETSPLGTLNQLLHRHVALPPPVQEEIRRAQGRPPFGVDLRIVDDEGRILPHDGHAQGTLQIRGHWIVAAYFEAGGGALTTDGWFDTGDIATISPDGYMTIRDRAKDMVKSGGEWISTVEIENIAIAHPAIANAAAIAARHPKWDERPVLIAVKRPGEEVTEAELLTFYQGRVAGWQVPDRVIFIDSLPLGGTGKVLKNRLRDQFGEVLMGQTDR
ncbi:MAG: long-chain fatty acid--CoA ligase [Proteobacteria bacterium]|nr:long-chain fatty acid--CoA ligase [Pseudomonadota bacterium]MBS0572770.1 long-chain fatty acid--CoA ligase [Pseudomonadota bacterium]